MAGGMLDGTVNLWKPSSLLANNGGAGDNGPDTAPVASITKHPGSAITALKFNPHATERYALASGGASGEVWVMECADSENVTVYGPGGSGNSGEGAGGASGQSGAEITEVSTIVCMYVVYFFGWNYCCLGFAYYDYVSIDCIPS